MNLLERYFDIKRYDTSTLKSKCKEAGLTFEQACENYKRVRLDCFGRAWMKVCPASFDETDPERIKPTKIDAVMKFDFSTHKGIYLFGKPGTQKTRSIYCLLARELLSGRSIIRLESVEFTQQASSATYNPTMGAEWLEKVCAYDILFIDDIFKNKMTEAQEFILFSVLDRRTSNCKPTIFTSNIGLSEACSMFTDAGQGDRAEAVMRRIKEFSRVLKFS